MKLLGHLPFNHPPDFGTSPSGQQIPVYDLDGKVIKITWPLFDVIDLFSLIV